jgi:molybdopterin-guanine dinucleotide biosynthesis protein B
MALVKPVIIQVVGYQNSGKTTFITKLLKELGRCGSKVVTIKHHGHGGKPEVPEQKDSTKHLNAGAIASMVEGEGRAILQVESDSFGLEKQIELLGYFQPDMIIIEGHKHAYYPKIVLLRDKADIPLLKEVNNIHYIFYWNDEIRNSLEGKVEALFISVHDMEAGIVMVVQRIMHVHKMDEKIL